MLWALLTLFSRSAEDRKSISTGALGGVGLPRLGLSFERKTEGRNSALQILQLESLEFGLLGNSEDLLWRQNVVGEMLLMPGAMWKVLD